MSEAITSFSKRYIGLAGDAERLQTEHLRKLVVIYPQTNQHHAVLKQQAKPLTVGNSCSFQ